MATSRFSERAHALAYMVSLFAGRVRASEKPGRSANDPGSLVLQTIVTVRKALQEAQRERPSNSISLELTVEDLEGWPRLILAAIDSRMPSRALETLEVSVDGSANPPKILFECGSGVFMGEFGIRGPESIKNVVKHLQGVLSEFFSIVEKGGSAILLQQPKKAVTEAETEKAINQEDSLFVEESLDRDNLVSAADDADLAPLSMALK